MTDELKKVPIKLYFPESLCLSEDQYKEVEYKQLLCTVEISHFGRRGPNSQKFENGIVKSMRVIFIQDRQTLEWTHFKLKNRQETVQVQEAISDAVIKGLGQRPERVNFRYIVPKDILTL